METWKNIKGYEGLYQVSDLGRVRSLDHYASNGVKDILYKGRILSQNLGTNGYLSVQLCKDNKTVRKTVHRLVGETFIENPCNLPMINHKDENKKNNCVNNLEWCDAKYNTNYGNAMKKLSEKKKGVENPKKWKNVLCIETNEIFKSVKEASEKTGTNKAAISMVLHGRRKRAGGFTWTEA